MFGTSCRVFYGSQCFLRNTAFFRVPPFTEHFFIGGTFYGIPFFTPAAAKHLRRRAPVFCLLKKFEKMPKKN